MATFGKETIGDATSSSDSDKILGSGPFILSEEGDVSKISWYGYLLTSAKNFRAGIYADSAGSPSGSVLGETQETEVGTSPQWWDFTFASPLHLTAANYWLFIFQDAGGGTLKWYREDATAQFAYQMATYPNWPDPISADKQDYIMSIYATYTPSAAPKGNITTLASQMGILIHKQFPKLNPFKKRFPKFMPKVVI